MADNDDGATLVLAGCIGVAIQVLIFIGVMVNLGFNIWG